MKKRRRNMKKLIVIIFIVFGAFLTFSLYRTYAYDTSVVEETPSTTDLECTFKIGNSSIKQITAGSGETKYYDVVLSNPNPAKISYGVYYEMVSPSTKPDSFSIEYTSKSTGESTGKVDKEGIITLNLVVTNTSSSSVTVKLGTVAGYVNGGDLELNNNQEFIPKKKFPKATELVESLNDNSTGDSGSGVYKVHHDAIPASSSATGEIIEATDDYRYYGSSPNNYICLDMEENSTCPDKHLYRIIGSIREDSDKKYKLKVIKATYLTDGITKNFVWDYNSSGGYSNDWAISTNGTYSNSLTKGSQLMKLLNSGAWWNGTSGVYYNGSTTATTINFSNHNLSLLAKKYIEISRFYLGGTGTTFNTITSYLNERGNKGGNSFYWDGYVGLMYLSDYGYAYGNNCASNYTFSEYGLKNCATSRWLSYLSAWTVSPDLNDSNNVIIASNSIINVDGPSYTEAYVYPTFYLKPEVVITTGDGSEQNPYQISLS